MKNWVIADEQLTKTNRAKPVSIETRFARAASESCPNWDSFLHDRGLDLASKGVAEGCTRRQVC